MRAAKSKEKGKPPCNNGTTGAGKHPCLIKMKAAPYHTAASKCKGAGGVLPSYEDIVSFAIKGIQLFLFVYCTRNLLCFISLLG